MGTLSPAVMAAPQAGQRDLGRTTDSPRGNLWMQTLAKLPTTSPRTRAKGGQRTRAASGSVSLGMAGGSGARSQRVMVPPSRKRVKAVVRSPALDDAPREAEIIRAMTGANGAPGRVAVRRYTVVLLDRKSVV